MTLPTQRPTATAILEARQLAERALAAERERLRLAHSSVGDGMILTDVDCRVTYLNEAAEALTGWTAAEAAGQPLPDVFHLVNRATGERASNPVDRCLREGVVIALAAPSLLICRDGSERPVDDSAAPIFHEDGSPAGTVLVFGDATERWRDEEVRGRLAAIVESSDDAIISKSLDGIIRTWNTGAQVLFGYSPEEAVGQHITLIIPRDRHDEEKEILARLVAGKRIDHFETVRIAKDGRQLDISLTVSPIRDAQGRVVGASKVARDVTERKLALEALRRADRRKDEFVALLAHELRNPLAPLRNGVELLRLTPDDPTYFAETRDMMDRQLSHMVRLVDDLLDMSRINRNRMGLRLAPILLSEVVRSAVESASPGLLAAGHELTVSLPPEPIVLLADLTRLAQVFGNLLNNSAKFTKKGGQIRLTAALEGDRVVVAVQDSGVGIPASALPDIFEMFSQVDRSLERATSGLGIGLALVKGLVEMHGGTVEAASPGVGQGSTFTVRLPIPKSGIATESASKRTAE